MSVPRPNAMTSSAVPAPGKRGLPLPSGILVVDDHDLVRLGLRSLVQSHAASRGQEMPVFEARTVRDALAIYGNHQAAIGLVLLDLHLPDAHGLSGLGSFMARFPLAHVVILSGDGDPALVRDAKANGACAYLAKSGDLEQVVSYIRSMELLRPDNEDSANATDPPPAGGDNAAAVNTRTVRTLGGESIQLTARQFEVLDWLLSGLSNREIADTAHLSEGTVKNHVSTLLLLFGVRSRAQLISQLR
jgi:DNA-binding NarL/FixJ family response regulator